MSSIHFLSKLYFCINITVQSISSLSNKILRYTSKHYILPLINLRNNSSFLQATSLRQYFSYKVSNNKFQLNKHRNPFKIVYREDPLNSLHKIQGGLNMLDDNSRCRILQYCGI